MLICIYISKNKKCFIISEQKTVLLSSPLWLQMTPDDQNSSLTTSENVWPLLKSTSQSVFALFEKAVLKSLQKWRCLQRT